MNKIKSLIIILIICIVLIIIAMIIISKLDTSENNGIIDNKENVNNNLNIEEDNQPDAPEERVTADNVTILTNTNTFFSIEKIISRYFLYLKAGNSEAVYDMIESEYKSLNGINEQNVLEIMRTGIPYDAKYEAKEIYVREDNYKPIYFIKGILEKDLVKTPYYLIMKQDKDNISFSLKPITAEEYEMYSKGTIKETFEKNIKLGKYNKIINISLNEEELAKKYFDSYIQNARYNPEEAYNSLNRDYRNKRFGSYQNFLEYLQDKDKSAQLESLDVKNVKEIEQFLNEEEYIPTLEQKTISKYQIYTEDNTKYCICLDQYNNYYIFKILDVMNYELYLDTYTIDLKYFTSKYNDTKSVNTRLNIERIFEAINNKDYEYVYEKMEGTKIFQNYQSFVNYVQSNLFVNNKIEFGSFKQEENISTYLITVTDNAGKNSKSLTIKIGLELGEGTDYKIVAFEIQN